jgi:hypothetical protein
MLTAMRPIWIAESYGAYRSRSGQIRHNRVAVAEFRQSEIISETPGPGTEYCVTVLRKPVEHSHRFKKVQEWAEPTTKGGRPG